MSVVLMYHGIYADDNDLQRITPEDRPYAVALCDFEAQITELAAATDLSTGLIGSVNEVLPDVIVTFDDGHISNFEHALPVLQRHAVKAYFFITTDFIQSRPHFCQWEDLAALAAAGMQIGTHGTSHLFFDDMTTAQAHDELSRSRSLVQDRLGVTANSMSFPGGRYNQAALTAAKELGYNQVYGSEFGVLSSSSDLQAEKPIPRVPIRQSTTQMQFSQFIHTDRRLFFTERAKAQGKQLLKKTLGNRIYHGLYTTLAKRN